MGILEKITYALQLGQMPASELRGKYEIHLLKFGFLFLQEP